MFDSAKIKRWLIGPPRDPLNPQTQKNIALVAFLAWIGLGADGLSSSCYGPEAAFLALGTHAHIALYLAIATALTVFIISSSYNQVIELFPNGGGGYRVATMLVGPYAGLVSGSALIVDYVLTITISIASGVDAIFSLLPMSAQTHKVAVEALLILFLIFLNLRGVKESIMVLMPIFIGFVVTHTLLIIYGVAHHADQIPQVVAATLQETHSLSHSMGWFFVVALFLHAYSLGGGTYTGLEAVSNNVNRLKSPRVRTGKWTMFYMAVSLSFTAGGIIFLYLLWNAAPVPGKTLNAVVFGNIMQGWNHHELLLAIVLVLEACLLFVGAETGFLGGPAVLANMSVDSWVPNRFKHLSSRLVTQNGIILFGIAALIILWLTHGSVEILVVLYSINVFITFTMSLLGLCVYWWRNRQILPHWRRRLALSVLGFVICGGILIITTIAKFEEGGWMTVVITSVVISMCLLVHRHYNFVARQLRTIDAVFATLPVKEMKSCPMLDPTQPTAVFFVGKNKGTAMHTLLWAQRMFPEHFKNFIFISAGIVDVESLGGKTELEKMKKEVGENLNYFVDFCHYHGFAAKSYCVYGTDAVDELAGSAEKINMTYTKSIFFSSRLVFSNDNWFTRALHFETANALQRRLHMKGMQMIILPMRVD